MTDFVSVPREATEEIIAAGISERIGGSISDIYKAMIEAAPAPLPGEDARLLLAAEREKFIMHTAHVEAWFSCLLTEFRLGKENEKIDVATACTMAMDEAKRLRKLFTAPTPPVAGEDAPSRIVELFGDRYDGAREDLSGGALTDLQVAHQTAMLMRDAFMFEGVLDTAKDRIRWLSRQLEIALAAHPSTVTSREQGLEALLRRVQPYIANAAKSHSRNIETEGDISALRDSIDRALAKPAAVEVKAQIIEQKNAALDFAKAIIAQRNDDIIRLRNEISRLDAQLASAPTPQPPTIDGAMVKRVARAIADKEGYGYSGNTLFWDDIASAALTAAFGKGA